MALLAQILVYAPGRLKSAPQAPNIKYLLTATIHRSLNTFCIKATIFEHSLLTILQREGQEIQIPPRAKERQLDATIKCTKKDAKQIAFYVIIYKYLDVSHTQEKYCVFY